MKKLTALAASAALLILAALPVAAQVSLVGNSCENQTTGPHSTNNCTINNTVNVTVRNYNDATVLNNVTSETNTGRNSTNNNTLGGTIVTGNSTNNTVVGTFANMSATNVSVDIGMFGNFGTNNVTGPSSINNILIRNGLTTDVDNENTAFVANNVTANADTGSNSASNNTGPGVILSGKATLGLGVGTYVNENLTNLRTTGGTFGNFAWNNTTGPYSTNNVTLNNTANVGVGNLNDAVVLNNVDGSANTGNNTANKNTLGGNITSGDAGAGVGVETEGNTSNTTVSMALGGTGNAGGNSGTGPDVVGDPFNIVSIDNTQNVVVDNQNNKGESHNCETTGTWINRLAWLLKFGPAYPTGVVDPALCDPANLGVLNNVKTVSDTGSNSASKGTGLGSVTNGVSTLFQLVRTSINSIYTNVN